MRNYFFIALVCLAIACGQAGVAIPQDVIPEEEMISLLTEMQIVESAAKLRMIPGDDMNQKALDHYAAIFSKHNTTREKFRESYEFYQRHPELLINIYDQVLNELSKKDAELRKVGE